MYRQLFFEKEQGELRHVVRANDYLKDVIEGRGSPFYPVGLVSRFVSAIATLPLRLGEYLIGRSLYVQDDLRELAGVGVRSRNLLLRLIKKGIIRSWSCGLLAPDLPRVAMCSIQIGPVQLPSGEQGVLHGSAGGGAGDTFDEAIVPALAELLERESLALWEPRRIVRGSYESLGRAAVDPELFSFFSDEQLLNPTLQRFQYEHTKEMGWVRAHELESGRRLLVPAQLVYIFYERVHSDEPTFFQTTTSGAAAGTSYEEAAYRAICEAVERDAFLIYWLNKISPRRIDPKSITDARTSELLKEMGQAELEVTLCHFATDLNIPIFGAVLTDRKGEVAVAVAAHAGFEGEAVFRKLLMDLIRYIHHPKSDKESVQRSAKEKYPDITSMDERKVIWSSQDMIQHLDFLQSGHQISASDVLEERKEMSPQRKLHVMRTLLRERGYQCYLVDVTSREAKRAGLRVVRALVPQLAPLYFDEREKCLGVGRMRTVPPYLKNEFGLQYDEKVNTIPHPFL